MGTTLEHGVYLPDEGERNCYAGLKVNWETLDQKVADISALQSAIAGALHREIVATLPTTDIDTATIYMILNGTSATENIYDEYMYISNAWELIGTSAIDLTNYYTKAEVDGKLLLKASASDLTSHTGDTTIHVTTSDKAKWNTVALIKQLRLVNAQVGSSTTIAFANIDDTNGIKVGDKCMDLDGKMFEITAVDTTNETVTVGSALIDIALDANVMHLTGDETSTGKKTFSDLTTFNSYLYFTNSSVTKGTIPQSTVTPYRIYFGSGVNYGASLFNIDTSVSNLGVQTLIFRAAENVVSGDDARFALIYDPNRTQPRYLAVKGGIEPNANNTYDCGSGTNIWKDLYGYHGYFMGQNQNDEYSSNARTNLTLLSNRDTLGVSGVLLDTYRQNTAQGTGIHILGLSIKENSIRYEGCRWGWYWDNNLNGYYFDFKPTTQGAYQAVKHNLGTSTDKWDTINGVEPSSLSMPDLNNAVDISGYITNLGSGTVNEYTPPANGWISIADSGDSPIFIRVYNDYGFEQVAYSERNEVGGTSGGTYSRFGSIMIPCVKDVKIYIIVSPSTSVLVSAKFYPCLGNI